MNDGLRTVLALLALIALPVLQPGCNATSGGGGGGGGSGSLNNQGSAESSSGGGGADGDGSGGTTGASVVNPFADDGEAECLGLSDPSDDLHREFFQLLNRLRVENDLPALEYSVRLEAAADAHARSMFEHDFFAHTAPDGSTEGERALEAGFCHDSVGENIAWGLNSRSNPMAAMDALMASEQHLVNMLGDSYRYGGVGFYHAVDESGDQYWWVQLFANDRSN